MDGVVDSDPSHGLWFQVLWNPFDDLVPRKNLKQPEAPDSEALVTKQQQLVKPRK